MKSRAFIILAIAISILFFGLVCSDLARAVIFICGTADGAPASGSIGMTDISANAMAIYLNNLYHEKWQPTVAGTVRHAHVYVNDTDGATICISLFNSSGTELASCSVSPADGYVGWANCDSGEDNVLIAATDYYVGIQQSGGDGSAGIEQGVSDAAGYYYDASYTYDCGGNVNAEESTRSGSGNKAPTMIWNNSSGNPS